jgi:hypothetical protein
VRAHFLTSFQEGLAAAEAAFAIGSLRLGPRCSWPRFVDGDGSAAERRSVWFADCALGLYVVRHLHKGEATRSTSDLIARDRHPIDLAVTREEVSKFLFGCLKVEIADVDVFHVISRAQAPLGPKTTRV